MADAWKVVEDFFQQHLAHQAGGAGYEQVLAGEVLLDLSHIIHKSQAITGFFRFGREPQAKKPHLQLGLSGGAQACNFVDLVLW